MIWCLAFEKKPFQFWLEIWFQVVVILLQLYLHGGSCRNPCLQPQLSSVNSFEVVELLAILNAIFTTIYLRWSNTCTRAWTANPWLQRSCNGPHRCHFFKQISLIEASYKASNKVSFESVDSNLFSSVILAGTYLQLQLRQWGAGNVHLLVLSSLTENIAEIPIVIMGL